MSIFFFNKTKNIKNDFIYLLLEVLDLICVRLGWVGSWLVNF